LIKLSGDPEIVSPAINSVSFLLDPPGISIDEPEV
jgi:hypothetical protein